MFNDDDDKSIVNHKSLHESFHNGGIGKDHSAFHDHREIHESMHLGKFIKNPLSHFGDD